MNIDFNGKRALVTGAGRGIGKVVVKHLVAANAQVVALSKTQANLDSLKAELPGVEICCCDLSNWKETEEKVKQLGDFDLLVNNAATVYQTNFGEITEEAVDGMFNPNVKAVINVTQIVVEGMKRRGGGSIVNVSSIAGLQGMSNMLVYGAGKAAMDQMTRTWSLELGPHKIRCNSVNPTIVWTEILKSFKEQAEEGGGFRKMLERTPIGRFAEPEEVADAIVFLLSDKAAMITGTCLPIDGGQIAS